MMALEEGVKRISKQKRRKSKNPQKQTVRDVPRNSTVKFKPFKIMLLQAENSLEKSRMFERLNSKFLKKP
ncbi:MAG: hypothetical protein M0018_05695 [Nitrospiraceae bacterium]|nr:hypothetical protein [Nitrospiraceae bacterium]